MTTPLRILARVVVRSGDKILLVRNRGAKYWYPPGGGWEYDHETITQCAIREVKEETGYDVAIDRMLWLQEFHTEGKIFFETFWLAHVDGEQNIQDEETLKQHIDADPDGMVEEGHWFMETELTDLKVFPERLKTFANLEPTSGVDPFIGAFL